MDWLTILNLAFSLVGMAGCGLYYWIYSSIKRRKEGAAE